MTRKQWILVCASTIAVACATYYLAHFRFLSPDVPEDLDQLVHRRAIQERTGVELPSDARIVSGTDGNPWDGMNGFYLWRVFMPRYFQFPHMRDGTGMFVKKRDMIESVEDGFWPRKILAPEGYTYHSWRNGEVEIRITAVKGKLGTYVDIETYDRRM